MDSTTRGLTQKLSKQVIAVNEIVSHALSMLLGENERKVFLAFANQTDIYTIARLMSVNESTVLVILESAITKLNKQSHSWIHNLASKYEDSCYRNQLLTAQLESYTKVVDLYKQIVKVYKDQKRCDEERIKTFQSIFEDMGRAGTHKPILSDRVDECVDKQTRGNEIPCDTFFPSGKR